MDLRGSVSYYERSDTFTFNQHKEEEDIIDHNRIISSKNMKQPLYDTYELPSSSTPKHCNAINVDVLSPARCRENRDNIYGAQRNMAAMSSIGSYNKNLNTFYETHGGVTHFYTQPDASPSGKSIENKNDNSCVLVSGEYTTFSNDANTSNNNIYNRAVLRNSENYYINDTSHTNLSEEESNDKYASQFKENFTLKNYLRRHQPGKAASKSSQKPFSDYNNGLIMLKSTIADEDSGICYVETVNRTKDTIDSSKGQRALENIIKQKDGYINELLEMQKELKENVYNCETQLYEVKKDLDKEKNEFARKEDGYKRRIIELESHVAQLKLNNSNLSEEVKKKNEQLSFKETQLQKANESKSREYGILVKENSQLKTDISELNIQIRHLQSENDNLSTEVDKGLSTQKYNNAVKKIAELETFVQDILSNPNLSERVASPQHSSTHGGNRAPTPKSIETKDILHLPRPRSLPRSNTQVKLHYDGAYSTPMTPNETINTFKSKCNKTSSSELLKIIQNELRAKSRNEIVTVIREIKEFHKMCKSSIKLTERLKDLVTECSPAWLYQEGSPSHKEVWRWLRNLINEFMALKRERPCGSTRILDIIHVKTEEEAERKIKQLNTDNNLVVYMCDKVKEIYNLEPNVTLFQIADFLEGLKYEQKNFR